MGSLHLGGLLNRMTMCQVEKDWVLFPIIMLMLRPGGNDDIFYFQVMMASLEHPVHQVLQEVQVQLDHLARLAPPDRPDRRVRRELKVTMEQEVWMEPADPKDKREHSVSELRNPRFSIRTSRQY